MSTLAALVLLVLSIGTVLVAAGRVLFPNADTDDDRDF